MLQDPLAFPRMAEIKLALFDCELYVLQIAHFQQTQIERVTTHYRHKSIELELRLKEVTEQAYRWIYILYYWYVEVLGKNDCITIYFHICDQKAALWPAERELWFKEAAFRAEEGNDRAEKATFSEEGKCSRILK